jgi:hypothetical protein
MFKRFGLFVIVVFILNSNSQPYLSLTTQGINFGVIKSRFDYGVGIDFRVVSSNNHSETYYQSGSGFDTVFVSDLKTTQFIAGPEVSIGYYFSDNKMRPFIQAFSEALFPIYSTYTVDQNSGGYFKEMTISGGLIGGIEYFFVDKISIGSGLGPYINYDGNENFSPNQNKSKGSSTYFGFTSNFHFRYYF